MMRKKSIETLDEVVDGVGKDIAAYKSFRDKEVAAYERMTKKHDRKLERKDGISHFTTSLRYTTEEIEKKKKIEDAMTDKYIAINRSIHNAMRDYGLHAHVLFEEMKDSYRAGAEMIRSEKAFNDAEIEKFRGLIEDYGRVRTDTPDWETIIDHRKEKFTKDRYECSGLIADLAVKVVQYHQLKSLQEEIEDVHDAMPHLSVSMDRAGYYN